MSKVKLVDKQVSMRLAQLIKYQILTHCFIEDNQVSDADLSCMTLLGTTGESDIAEFCNIAAVNHIFKTAQTVRNCVIKLEKMKLIIRDSSKKKISLNPLMKIQTKGNILLQFKFYHIDTEKS